MKKILMITSVIVVLVTVVFFFFGQRTTATREVGEEFTFEMLQYGDIQNLVSSTGTLEAVGTVKLGSQIAGTVDKVYVDYNDTVTKGQLLALVDTTRLEVSVRETQASLARSNAQLRQAQTEYDRYKKLFDEGLIAELSFLEKETVRESAAASVESAKAALENAQTNLSYAEIRSPLAGTVIERDIEVGQTIVSDSEAGLFIIADDLAYMQIEALVDETDIGHITEGMAVRFTVQAYPDDEFTGTVRQVRLNPTKEQNVVSYIVIVDAQNDTGTLLPGMTATADFIVEERFGALLVPNAALSFQPSQPQMPADGNREARPSSAENLGQMSADGNTQASGETVVTHTEQEAYSAEDIAQVYYLEQSGRVMMAEFVQGATDGLNTVVAHSSQLTEGIRVITGVEDIEESSESAGLLSFLQIPGLGGGDSGGPQAGGGPPAGGGGPPPGGGR